MSPSSPPAYGPPISLEEARRVCDAAHDEARRQGWSMVVAVVDSGARLVCLQRADQAQLGSLDVALGKAETAVRFKRPTQEVEAALAAGGIGLRLLSVPGVVAIDGGLPLLRNGQLVGAIGVSGMRPQDDAAAAAAGRAAL